jgi:hypothetical protein
MMPTGAFMPDVVELNSPNRHRYPVTDAETKGVYIVVSEVPKTPAELERVVAGVIRDEGRVRAHKVRLILL